MQSTVRIKYPVAFDPGQHIYADPFDHSKRFTSVTELIKQYSPEISDEEMIGLYNDPERGAEKLAQMPENSRIAREFGTNIDRAFQDVYNGKEVSEQLFSKPAYQRTFIENVRRIKEDYPPMELQIPLICPDAEIAGTIDASWWDGIWFPGDIKTGQKPTNYNMFGKSMLPPFDHLPFNYFTKYRLQLSFYAYLLRANGNDCSDQFTIFHFGKSGKLSKVILWEEQSIYKIIESRKFKL